MNHRLGKPDEEGKYEGMVSRIWHHPNYSHPRPDETYMRGMPKFTSLGDVRNNARKIVGRDMETPYYTGSKARRNKNWYVSPIWDTVLESNQYPVPMYQSDTLIDSAVLDAALSAFDVASIKNGLTAGYIITVPVAGIETLKRKSKKKAQAEDPGNSGQG